MRTSTSTSRTFPRGLIYREGDAGAEMYEIGSGQVKITKNMYGIMVTISELGPGDCFGEMALVEDAVRSATAIAETPVEVDVYDLRALTQRVAAEPEFAFSMMRAMSRRLRLIDDRLTDLVAKGRLPKEEAAKLSGHAVC
jgi:CRP/FNR family cyclic AMP-dependent transcriptional regulator